MRLFRVEIRRLLARRFTRLALLLLIGGLGLVVAIGAHNSHRATPADLAAAQQQADQVNHEQKAQCDAAKKNPSAPDAAQFGGQDCASLPQLRAEDMLGFQQFSFHDDMPAYVLGVSVMVSAFGFLVGASFIGAEWNHSTMSGLLLWEPRRWKVFTTKLAALWTLIVVAGAGALGAVSAAMWWVADHRGNLDHVTVGFQRALALEAVRGLAVALAITAVGFALAYATRITAAAIGLAFAYVVGGEIGMHFVSQSGVRWLVSSNLVAWMQNGFQVFVDQPCAPDGGCPQKVITVHLWQGGVYLGAIALVLLVLSGVTFARRDVT